MCETDFAAPRLAINIGKTATAIFLIVVQKQSYFSFVGLVELGMSVREILERLGWPELATAHFII